MSKESKSSFRKILKLHHHKVSKRRKRNNFTKERRVPKEPTTPQSETFLIIKHTLTKSKKRWCWKEKLDMGIMMIKDIWIVQSLNQTRDWREKKVWHDSDTQKVDIKYIIQKVSQTVRVFDGQTRKKIHPWVSRTKFLF